MHDILDAAEDSALLSASADAAGCLARLGGLANRLAASQADAERTAAHRRTLDLPPASQDALQHCAAAARALSQQSRALYSDKRARTRKAHRACNTPPSCACKCCLACCMMCGFCELVLQSALPPAPSQPAA